MPLFLRQRIELKPFQAWDVVSPRPLLTILNSASLSLLSDSVPDPPLPSSASVRLDPWGLLIPGPRSPGFSWRWPTETQVAGNHGASSLQRASRRSLPLCPPSTRISGFLTILCWAPPPCPWFWPVPQIMLSRQVAGVDSISSQNLTRHHLSFLFHSYLSPYTSWCLVIRKCYFFLPWDLPLPRQHHLLSSPLDWMSIQWSQRVSPSSSSWCSDRKHLLKLTPAYSPLILASLQFWSLRQPTGFMVDYESWSKAIF